MSASRRILIVNRHFWPDVTTYSHILRHMAERWASDGHRVEVLTAHPSYRPELAHEAPAYEKIGAIEIFRLRLFPFRSVSLKARLANSIPFFLGFIWHFFRRWLSGVRYDYVLVATNPPVLEALLGRLLCAVFGGRIIYHIQDIHPDLEVLGGYFRAGGLLSRFFRMLDSYTCRNAAKCIVLSDDMMRTILARPDWRRRRPDIHIINNFVFEPGDTASPPPEYARDPGSFRVIFAGNIGHFQGLDQLIEAAHLIADFPEVEIVLVGNGIAVDRLKQQAGALLGKTVRFIQQLPMPEAQALIKDADLAVVILKSGVVRLAYPSKTMTYAASGTPILAVVEKDCELAGTIAQNELGLIVPQNDPAELAAAIRSAFDDRERLREGREARKARGISIFGREQALDKWSCLIKDMMKEK